MKLVLPCHQNQTKTIPKKKKRRKKGEKETQREGGNYRPISLINIGAKNVTKLSNIIQQYRKRIANHEQVGFIIGT